METVRLTAEQFTRLYEVLYNAFDMQDFEVMLSVYAHRDPKKIFAQSMKFPNVVIATIRAAEMQGWLPQLVDGMRRANPENQDIASFAQGSGISPVSNPLEQKIRKDLPFLDIVALRKWLVRVEAQICQVEAPGPRSVAYGTGFLLNRDIIMTNHHVVAQVIDGPRKPEHVALRFDYKKLDGQTINRGTIFRLAPADWLVECSPPAPSDALESDGSLPKPTELDYALLRLAVPVGDMPVYSEAPGAGGRENLGSSRGWLSIPMEDATHLEPGDPMFIVQHPDQAPIKLAYDTESVLSVNANGTRVRYKTNTEPGSSGSPCFDSQFQLVALHHSGDAARPNPKWNEGIPFSAILAHLEQCGKARHVAVT